MPTIKIKPIDTTGAGDAFYACVLRYLNELDITNLDFVKMKEILTKANRCGALACSKKGALSALPTLSELEKSL